MFGNGERTGNRVVLAVASPRLDLSFFREITDTDTDCPGMPVSPRHSGFGECVCTAFPESPPDAIRKTREDTMTQSSGSTASPETDVFEPVS